MQFIWKRAYFFNFEIERKLQSTPCELNIFFFQKNNLYHQSSPKGILPLLQVAQQWVYFKSLAFLHLEFQLVHLPLGSYSWNENDIYFSYPTLKVRIHLGVTPLGIATTKPTIQLTQRRGRPLQELFPFQFYFLPFFLPLLFSAFSLHSSFYSLSLYVC